MCIGAYLGGKAAVILEPMLGEWPALIVSIILGGVVAAVFGMIIGLPALRLRGDYLAIVTLAFGEIVRSVFMNSSKESFGGSLGLDTPRFDKDILFVVAFLMVLATLAVTQNLIRSKHGRAITAIRDNEIAARATGIDVTKYKLLVFTVSSFFAGIAGVLYSYSNFTVQSTKFSYNYSIEILVMVVLGGMGSINGAIIAATLITFLDVELQTILTGNLAVLQDLIYALILIVLVIYNNAPALKNFREKYNLKAFINKFRPHVPSKHKDDEAKWDRVPTKIKMDEVLSVDFQVDSPYTPDKPGKEKK
jgi:branched-chain amino acid transport system permease protein